MLQDLPLSLSVRRDLLRMLLVMSGIVFCAVKFNSDLPLESIEDLKLNEGTDALKILELLIVFSVAKVTLDLALPVSSPVHLSVS